MANIEVNVGDLYDRKNKMEKIGEELISLVDQVVNQVNQVNAGWTGFNSNEYLRAFTAFKPKMLKKCSAILMTANGLYQTAQMIDKAQQEIKAKINNMGTTTQAASTNGNNINSNNGSINVSENNSTSETNVEDIASDSSYNEGEIFKATSYGHNYTEEEFIELAAIIGGEDSGSYEGALAVASTMCNRSDVGVWGGSHPLEVAKVPNQFVAYKGNLYNEYMSDPSSIPQHVIDATRDALAGTRNTTADSFRAGPGKSDNRIQIGDGGNYYFRV